MDSDDHKIRDITAYFCRNYPFPEELSKARITKLVYLADWRNALDNGEQLTSINWFFNNYGPYVDDVVAIAKKDSNLKVTSTSNVFGRDKDLVSLKNPEVERYLSLTKDDKSILDAVIEATKSLNFNAFIEFVYGTHPVESSERYTNLDLVKFASEYREEKGL